MKPEQTIGVLLFKKSAEAEEILRAIGEEAPPEWKLLLHEECPLSSPPDRMIRASVDALRKSSLLLSLGGDGTVLSAARIAVGNGIPILGVHIGRTGFLTDCPPSALRNALAKFASGQYETQSRTTLAVRLIREGKAISEEIILNEVQINPPASSHRYGQLVDLRVAVDDHYLTDYHADFLLVTTPTGSTGYNLSAGGPIIHPSTRAIAVQAVNSPALSVRPLVLDDSARLSITSNEAKAYTVLLDGRITWTAEPADLLQVERSPHAVRFIKTDDYTFVDALREKLGWCGHPQFKKEKPC